MCLCANPACNKSVVGQEAEHEPENYAQGGFYGNFLLYTYCNFLSPPVLFLVSPCAILLKNTLEVPLDGR